MGSHFAKNLLPSLEVGRLREIGIPKYLKDDQFSRKEIPEFYKYFAVAPLVYCIHISGLLLRLIFPPEAVRNLSRILLNLLAIIE
jgi:hypothetical protein